MSGLRVALVAGTLGRGGAEKQFVYMATALREAGAEVRTYSMTRGEHHEDALAEHGLAPTWVGWSVLPPLRAAALAAAVSRFRPHVLQAGHFFLNLHVTAAAALTGAVALGAIRSDVRYELATHGRWGPRLLRIPPDLITNTWAAKAAAERLGRQPATVHVVPNVIDLAAFDVAAGAPSDSRRPGAVALAVGNLLPVKRFDRFLEALAAARRRGIALAGAVVGDGPERAALEGLAARLGLLPDGVRFLGARSDVPALLADADFLVVTSGHEGFPNVVLEAYAASRPVIATPCGDLERLVREETTGFVVPFDDVDALADRMARLAESAELRRRAGVAGRSLVERSYGRAALAGHLLGAYQAIAARRRSPQLAEVLA